MHSGRIDGGKQGEGVKKVKISGCDKEHEDHEMLVEYFQVRITIIQLGLKSKVFLLVRWQLFKPLKLMV